MSPPVRPYFFHALQLAAHRLKKFSDRSTLNAAGVTTAQAAVLYVVERDPGISQRGIAAVLRIRESGVASMILRLLAAGLVARTPDPDDARSWRIGLSAKGKRALQLLHRTREQMNRKLADAMGADVLADLAEKLSAVSKLKL